MVLMTAAPAAADTLRVGKAGREAFSFAPADIGVQTGIFKKHGLDLDLSSFGGDARVQQALTADGIDVGLGSGPGLAFIVKGSPVKGIAAMAGPPLLFALMVRADDTVKTVGDLKDRKVGVSTVGSVTSWIVSEVSRQQGWGFGGIVQEPIGDDATRIAALRTRSVDAAIVNIAAALKFAQLGEGRILLRFNDLISDFHVHVIFATDKAIAARPATLRSFLKGWFETIGFMKANKAKTVEITAKVINLSPSVVGRTYNEEIGMFSLDGTFDPKAVAALKRSFLEMGLLKDIPDDQVLFTTKFVPVKVGM